MSSSSLVEGLEAELGQHRLQELRGCELGLRHDSVHDVFVKLRQERLQQRGLPRADFSGDYHEAVSEPDRRLHVSLRPGVLFAPIQEIRVRRQPKRLFLKIEVTQIRHIGSVYLLLRPSGYAVVSGPFADYVTLRLIMSTNSSRSAAVSAVTVMCPSLRPGRALLP